MSSFITASQAQKSGKSSKSVQGYAITAADKGGHSWREVRLMDINAGAEVKNIYDSKKEIEPLNARTGKAIEKKETTASKASTVTFTRSQAPEKRVVNLDDALSPNTHTRTITRVVVFRENPAQSDKPFATNSAAMAYDKKHERLYYTPMSINQLRYIDLKSGKIYYFEGEDFGVVKSGGDVGNQITRMVIASDGNGYALTNNANHLIRFTTGKKPEITDLGAVTDDAAAKISVHSSGGYGGDMVADASGNLYLITAGRNVFKINIDTKAATYVGAIKGLPKGFSTNGAMVEEGSKVIVASSESTVGYYRFDLKPWKLKEFHQKVKFSMLLILPMAFLLLIRRKKTGRTTKQKRKKSLKKMISLKINQLIK
jgi:hypothetical protein